METLLFFNFPAAQAQEYTDLEKYFSQSGDDTELTKTYRSCLSKGELLLCKINHDHVSAEQKLGLTKVRPYLFLMLINPIAPTLTVPNRTVILLYAYWSSTLYALMDHQLFMSSGIFSYRLKLGVIKSVGLIDQGTQKQVTKNHQHFMHSWIFLPFWGATNFVTQKAKGHRPGDTETSDKLSSTLYVLTDFSCRFVVLHSLWD